MLSEQVHIPVDGVGKVFFQLFKPGFDLFVIFFIFGCLLQICQEALGFCFISEFFLFQPVLELVVDVVCNFKILDFSGLRIL